MATHAHESIKPRGHASPRDRTDRPATPLRDYRLRRDLTMRELAAKAGIGESYYRMIERGTKTPPAELLVDILDTLGVEWRVSSKDTITTAHGDDFRLSGKRRNRSSEVSLAMEIRAVRECLHDIRSLLRMLVDQQVQPGRLHVVDE